MGGPDALGSVPAVMSVGLPIARPMRLAKGICLVTGYEKALEAGQWYLHCLVFR